MLGVADERKGEVGHAFVVRSSGSAITEDEVIAWCRANIAGYKIPAGITFVDALPRNSQGKVLKQELRAIAIGRVDDARAAEFAIAPLKAAIPESTT